ncbi:glycosyltransferase family 4 protein [Ekhidna sp.]|uniref:glycosyltransferase family 4 protein n=1 Tax=Ekhidna sp. TaxID=2608089 RepID=UPI0032988193
MNILFFANPKSVHDRKWMQFIANNPAYKCFLISRKIHEDFDSKKLENIEFIKPIQDFSILRFWRSLVGIISIYQIIKRNKIDIFHIIYAEPNALWAIGIRLYKIPMILTTRGTDVLKAIPGHFKRRSLLQLIIQKLYKESLNSFSAITCTSQRQVQSLLDLGIESKYHIVRTGVNVESMMKVKDRKLIEKPYILFPRLMKPIYNHEFSIEALSLLTKSIKEMYQVIFLDKDSKEVSYVHKIDKMIKAVEGLDFLFLNRINEDELHDLYKNASLCVMNPVSDGSPVSAMEAMFFNCPLILGPLDYDSDIFGSITKLESWEPLELAGLIEESLEKSNGSKPNTKKIILEKGNRSIEMERLCNIYHHISRL